MEKPILVMATGGTIGSAPLNGVIDLNPAALDQMLAMYQSVTQRPRESFEVDSTLQTFSENLIPAEWQTLIRVLTEKSIGRYAGILVLSGTDTLAYTAAVLSYAFRTTAIPWVMVTSNAPIADADANGLPNFIAAVDFIRNAAIPGVFVIYRDANGRDIVHRGTRLREASPFTHQFLSGNNAYFGEMQDGRFRLNPTEPSPSFRPQSTLGFPVGTGLVCSPQLQMIRPYPGLNYDRVQFGATPPKAILHGLYHSGTACEHGPDTTGSYSLLEFSTRCQTAGIPLYAAPVTTPMMGGYVTSKALRDTGVRFLPNLTLESAWVKLCLAYGSFRKAETIARFLDAELCFEHRPD